MANSISRTRTNYFKVKNEDEFLKLINECATDDPEGMEAWTSEDTDGTKLYAFACAGDLLGLRDGDDEDCDYDYDGFIAELQKLLPDDEAVIISSVCFEKLRYVHGDVHVVTREKSVLRTLYQNGIETARLLLGNEKWDTKNDY